MYTEIDTCIDININNKWYSRETDRVINTYIDIRIEITLEIYLDTDIQVITKLYVGMNAEKYGDRDI